MRAHFVCLLTMFLAIGISVNPSGEAPDFPLVPLVTNFSYFDHHWIHWLQNHPVYESIEAENYLRPDGNTFVRVFLTERAGSKKQVFYFNDEAVARYWRPAEAHFREIEFATNGNVNEPLGLHVKLKDKDDKTIDWTMTFASGTTLGNANQTLTQTAPHAWDTAFMFLFYGNRTKALRSEINIGEYHDLLDEKNPPEANANGQSGATHSSHAYVPLIALGTSRLSPQGDTLVSSTGHRFQVVERSEKGTTWRSEGFGIGGFSVIEVREDSRGGVESYSHSFPGHEFRFDFSPSLPRLDALKDGQRFEFRITLDDHRDFVVGSVRATHLSDGAALDWKAESPEWLGQYPWVSEMHGNGVEGYSLALKRKQ